jgi:hypothetical protein
VDLGQTHDFTAIVGLVRADHNELHVTGLDRLALGTPYPTQVAAIQELTKRPELAGNCLVAVDATGVGAPVVDMLRPALRRPTVPFYAVTITAGDLPNRDGRNWRIPKRDLIAAAQVALQEHRLRIPAALAEARTLREELLAYRVTISAGGRDSYGNDWRQAPNDDLVLALAIGVYVADKTVIRSSAHTLASMQIRGAG